MFLTVIYKVKGQFEWSLYYDFIRREGLSLAIWFDIVESAFGENMHMTVYKCSSVDVFGTKARMDTYRI